MKPILNLTQGTLDIIANYMDDEKREQLHGTTGLDTPKAFLEAYVEEDPSFVEVLNSEFTYIFNSVESNNEI
jgi:hypothetical protein